MKTDKEKEELRRAAELLLTESWISRQEMPEEYFLIRRYEKQLVAFFREKCGWPVLVNAKFYKLEKIPAEPQPFMGIAAMQSPEDYVLLCCTMAFLEEQEVEGQFLLGDLCEALLGYYPQAEAVEPLNWESYDRRKALIRVIHYLTDSGILRTVEDDSEAFLRGGMTDGSPVGEALYEVTIFARCFLRSYPRDIREYTSAAALCAADFAASTADSAGQLSQKRHRIYRSLLLQPVYYRTAATEEDFVYLRSMNSRLNGEFSDWFSLNLELYRDAVMAVSGERSSWFADIFPYRMRGIHDVILHFSRVWQAQPEWQTKTLLSRHEFQQFLARLQQTCGDGWTREFREMAGRRLSETVLAEMVSWGMAVVETDNGLVRLLPALFRLSGHYPADYRVEAATHDSK